MPALRRDGVGGRAGSVNAAELRIATERIGLPLRSVAAVLGITERSIGRYAEGARPIPDGVADDIADLEDEFEEAVASLVEAVDTGMSTLLTYRRDRDLVADYPGREEYPASWHRAVVGQALVRRPGVRVEYADPTGSVSGRYALSLGA